MPTLFERIDTGLQGNDLSVRLSVQTNNLTSVASAVAGLINNPPQSIGDLMQSLDEQPMPDLQVGGDFAARLADLQAALPADLSVTGNLTADLQQLRGSFEDFAGLVRQAIETIDAIVRLTQLDPNCILPGGVPPPFASAQASGNGTPAPEPPPTDGTDSGEGEATASPPSPLSQSLDEIEQVFDLVPSPFNVEGVLALLNQGLNQSDLRSFFPRPIPLSDDFQNTLETLHTWKATSDADITAHLAQTLNSAGALLRNRVEGLVNQLGADLTAVASQVDAQLLAEIADTLTAQLNEIRLAVDSNDLSETSSAVSAINAALDQYDTVRATLQAGTLGGLAALETRLQTLADNLEDQMSHVMSVLQPNGAIDPLVPIPPTQEMLDLVKGAFEALDQTMTSIVVWFQDLLQQIDLTALNEQLDSLVNTVHSAMGSLDAALVNVTLDVQNLFGEVESLLDQVDTSIVVDQVEAAINSLSSELNNRLAELMELAQSGIGEAINAIEEGVNAFDPEDVIDALRDAIQTLTGVLQDPTSLSAVEDIRGTLEGVQQQLEAISFAPLTNEVIQQIEEVTEALRGIDPSQLNPALQGALTAAVAILPEDLTPVTDTLIDELDELVETGPVALLVSVQAQPQRLLDEVRRFQPAALLGDALAGPFNALLSELHAFQPSQLLGPVEAALESFKDRLRENANPGQAIAPLEAPFQALLAAFDQLDPEELVRTLEEQISNVVDGILEGLPLDDLPGAVADQVRTVVQQVQSIIDIGDRIINLSQRLRDLLTGFDDAQGQMQAWIDSILGKVASLGNTAPIQQALAELKAAFDAAEAASLTESFNAAAGPLLATFGELDARSRLTGLVQAYRDLSRPALDALLDSPEKAALLAALHRFDPVRPAFAAPYLALAGLHDQVSQAKVNLSQALSGWDVRYHGEGGLSACFRGLDATAVNLHQWLSDTLEGSFTHPLKTAFMLAEGFQVPLDTLITSIQALVAELRGKLAELLQGPEALLQIHASINGLIQQLRDFNLDFLRDSLNDLFATVRGKVEAVNPAQVREVIEARFDDMLDLISIDHLMPNVGDLDAAYAEVVAKIDGLDPSALVIEVVQPEFEAAMEPLLASFNLTEILNTLIDRLRGLDVELRSEMERVNDAYRELRGAIPSLDLSISVDIGL